MKNRTDQTFLIRPACTKPARYYPAGFLLDLPFFHQIFCRAAGRVK
jgi:hypothetical protein